MCTAIDHWGNGSTEGYELVLEALSFVEDTFFPSLQVDGSWSYSKKGFDDYARLH